MYEQKDIVLVPFPYSDLTGSKQRPALIISNSKINKTEDRICCLITTKPHKDDLLIRKDFFESGNLPFESYIKPHRIFNIYAGAIKKKLCTISSKFHDKVIERLNEYLRKD